MERVALGIDGTRDQNILQFAIANDYYPFGMQMPGRKFATESSYRYGFNGKEHDPETGTQDYGLRIYNPSLARFLSVDPLSNAYPHYTPYSYAGNKPIKYIDIDGAEEGRHWYDYDFRDFMNWMQKPDNPLKTDGFAHKAASGFNRDFNPLNNLLIITTGYDGASSDYPRMSRGDAAVSLTTQLILHKTISISTAPTAQVGMERQVARAVSNKIVPGGEKVAAAKAAQTEVQASPQVIHNNVLRQISDKLFGSLYGTTRGTQLERVLATTRYSEWIDLNLVVKKNIKLIDFLAGNRAASLKTFDAATFKLSDYRRIVDDLSEAAANGGLEGVKFSKVNLDIMFKNDEVINTFKQSINKLIDYGHSQGVRVNVFTDPVRKASVQ
ncbi:RHS repeat-associated core domain-containing protein [Flaviaesturariibacter amylovorans]|uniref:RHS repeat-associated core domain-containing protein n=1 Tax=Flaviaesturariibacter amylovorans TaxID=1084520 RepID=A0ABP8GBS2_9BACT